MSGAKVASLKTTHDLNREEALNCAEIIHNFVKDEDVVAFATILMYKDGTSRTMVTQYDDHLRMLGAVTKLAAQISKSEDE